MPLSTPSTFSTPLNPFGLLTPSTPGPTLSPEAEKVAGEANEAMYGGALRPGEGTAMAAYVQDGKRIPRRGEVRFRVQGLGFRFRGSGFRV